jgi:hypothetical protein
LVPKKKRKKNLKTYLIVKRSATFFYLALKDTDSECRLIASTFLSQLSLKINAAGAPDGGGQSASRATVMKALIKEMD